MTYIFGLASMRHYLSFMVTSTTQSKAPCMALTIQKTFGKTFMSIQWQIFCINMNNGHAYRIRVSLYIIYTCQVIIECHADLNKHESLETM